MENYKKIARHYEECYEENGDTCKGVDWPNWNDAETRYEIMLGIINFYENKYGERQERPNVLDFGCGLGHLYEYSKKNGWDIEYSGLDVSYTFVDKCREKYPEVNFICKDILKEEIMNQYDYIIMNGVFTEKLDLSYEEMWGFLTKMLKQVWKNCNKGIAFNVMSKDVDWEREDLFHVPLSQLSAWLTQNLTRDFIIRYDYGLYEYTVYIMKGNR